MRLPLAAGVFEVKNLYVKMSAVWFDFADSGNPRNQEGDAIRGVIYK